MRITTAVTRYWFWLFCMLLFAASFFFQEAQP